MSETGIDAVRSSIRAYSHMGRAGLLPALHAVQEAHGWISEEVAAQVATELRVPLADVHGVIEFYSLFYSKPVGREIHRICTDVVCALRGGDQSLTSACKAHGIQPGETTRDGRTTVEASPCLGLCEHAPVALVNSTVLAGGTDASVDLAGSPPSRVGGVARRLTANCGHGTTPLASYGRYEGLERALTMRPEEIVQEVKVSGLVGRGGAAFPTGLKWEGAAAAPGLAKYVICNADESEPGTFKDRVLLLDDPHRVIEGVLIAARAIGASRGYVYIRGEYPYVVPVMEAALEEARQAGYMSVGFDVEVRVGAGAYICGEETALFESIEGKRGFPRVKPPFPTTHGLFGDPTVINNVETLANVPDIIRNGPEEYRRRGTEKSPGTKLFCLSGDVASPGLYEVPFGTTFRELLSMAGGVAGERSLQAMLVGGAAGAFATAEQLDVRLTFEDMRAAGLPIGSGVLVVFDETRDLRDTLWRLGRFFAHESCGKCFPCQMGTQRQLEILERMRAGNPLPGDMERLQDVGWTMTDASLCGLGQTAATAVLSALKLWPDFARSGPESRSKRWTARGAPGKSAGPRTPRRPTSGQEKRPGRRAPGAG